MRFFETVKAKTKGFAIGAFVGFCATATALSDYIGNTDNPNYLLALGALGAAITGGGVVGAAVTPGETTDDASLIDSSSSTP